MTAAGGVKVEPKMELDVSATVSTPNANLNVSGGGGGGGGGANNRGPRRRRGNNSNKP
jgi:hypothetical protein